MDRLLPFLVLLGSLLAGCVVTHGPSMPDAVQATLPRFSANYTHAGSEAWLALRTTTATILGPDAKPVETWSVEADFRPFRRPEHTEFFQWRWLLDGQGTVIRFDRSCGYDNLEKCERAFAHFDAAGHTAPFGLSLPHFELPATHIVGGIEVPLPIHDRGSGVFQVGDDAPTSDWPLLATPYVVAFDRAGIPSRLQFQYGRLLPNVYELERVAIDVDGTLPPVPVQPAPLLSVFRGGGKAPVLFAGAEELAFDSDVTYKDAFDHFLDTKPEAKAWLAQGCLHGFAYSNFGGKSYFPVPALNTSVTFLHSELFLLTFALDAGHFESWKFTRQHDKVAGNNWSENERGQNYQPYTNPCGVWKNSPRPLCDSS